MAENISFTTDTLGFSNGTGYLSQCLTVMFTARHF
jgi:hypothetical protein